MKNECDAIAKLIGSFMMLPGVGYKTAQRYAYSIMNKPLGEVKDFAESLIDVKQNVKFCSICGNFTEDDICNICKSRKSDIICVVKDARDVVSMEKVRNFGCLYHVLGGCISPLEGKGPDDLRIKELLSRISTGDFREVIMATNPDVEGEATALYIARLLKPLGIKVTRLAQGISIGSDLEYADEITLTKAIESRTTI